MRPLSARNPRVKALQALARRADARAEDAALVVEGPTLVAAAIDAGWDIRDLYLDEASLDRPGVEAVRSHLPEGTEPWVLPAGVLDRVGDVATSQGVLAVVAQREPRWPEPERCGFVLVLEGLQIPGNVGTLIRAAAAAGAGAVVCSGGADATSPKVVRASAGAIFGLDVHRVPAAEHPIDRLAADGYRIATAVVSDGVPYDTADLHQPIAVVLGSEAHGASDEAVAAADVAVSIPMAGPTESLNVAMAGTLLCFEVLRRHR